MRFSIIIPIYNVEKYLHICVDSVLTQTFTDFEVILVDDGSPDSCPLICDEYVQKDKRVSVIHQKNAGIACARNAGIKQARGDYVICIDSDDFLINDKVLEKISEQAKNTPDVIQFGYRKYFESDASWGEPLVSKVNKSNSIADIVRSQLLDDSYIATAWTRAVRWEILIDNNIFFKPGMVSGEDVDWYFNLLCNIKNIEVVSSPCLAYRQRHDSISHRPKIQSLSDFIWIINTWSERIPSLKVEAKLGSVMMNALAYYFANILVLYSRYDNSTIRGYRKQVMDLSYIQEHAITSRALTIKKFYSFLGFDITILLLKIFGKIKKQQ